LISISSESVLLSSQPASLFSPLPLFWALVEHGRAVLGMSKGFFEFLKDEIGHCLDDPVMVVFADRGELGGGCRVHELMSRD